MKKILCLILAISLMVSNGAAFATTDAEQADSSNDEVVLYENSLEEVVVEFAGGDGTEENPYQVATAEQLNAVRNNLTAFYVQVNDIDLSGIAWQPIGTKDTPFAGTYDGDNYSIFNLEMTGTYNVSNIGMWGYVGYRGVLKNINLKDCLVEVDDTTISQFRLVRPCIGALAGMNRKGTVIHCSVSGQVSASKSQTELDYGIIIGGILGCHSEGTFTDCINYANVDIANFSGVTATGAYVTCGGIVGRGHVERAINYGNISGTATDYSNCGGIAGESSKIVDCVNFGNISAVTLLYRSFSNLYNCNAGGIQGKNANQSTKNCVNFGNVSALAYKSKSVSAGGIVGGSQGSIRNCYNLGCAIDSVGQKKVEIKNSSGQIESVEWVYEASEYVGRILGKDRSCTRESCYSLDTTTLNGLIPEYDIGPDKNNGANMTQDEIRLAISGILKVVGIMPKDFNRFVYQANSLQNTDWSAIETMWENLIEETYCHRLLVDAQSNTLFNLSTSLWEACELVSDSFGDISSTVEFFIEPKDIYLSIILSLLQGKLNSEVSYSDLAHDGEAFFDALCDEMKISFNIDIMNANDFRNLTSEQKDKLQDLANAFFKDKYSEFLKAADVADILEKGLDIVEDIEDYQEKMEAYFEIACLSDSMNDVIYQAYLESKKSGDWYLQSALRECYTVLVKSRDDLIASMKQKTFVAAGAGTTKFLVDKYWEHVSASVISAHPAVAFMQGGYQFGKIIANALGNTDSIIEQYNKMLALAEIERIFDLTHDSLRKEFLEKQTTDTAKAYLNAVELVCELRRMDCYEASAYADVVDNAWLSKIFGTEAEMLKNNIRLQRSILSGIRFDIHTTWIEMLDKDYPNSGLYEKYSAMKPDIYKSLLIKKYTIECPVDVFVYDSSDDLVASVSAGRVFNSCDNLTVILNNDHKELWFYDDADYRVEYIGTDSGKMDISVEEYDEESGILRSVELYDIPLDNGTKYDTATPNESQSYGTYSLRTLNGDLIDPDYDSIETEMLQHTLSIETGSILHKNDFLISTQATENESVKIHAYVPVGYEFEHWEASRNDVVFEDKNAPDTCVRMVDDDLLVRPILKEAETNGYEITLTNNVHGVDCVELENVNNTSVQPHFILTAYDVRGKLLSISSMNSILDYGDTMSLPIMKAELNEPVILKAFVLSFEGNIPLRNVWSRILY